MVIHVSSTLRQKAIPLINDRLYFFFRLEQQNLLRNTLYPLFRGACVRAHGREFVIVVAPARDEHASPSAHARARPSGPRCECMRERLTTSHTSMVMYRSLQSLACARTGGLRSRPYPYIRTRGAPVSDSARNSTRMNGLGMPLPATSDRANAMPPEIHSSRYLVLLFIAFFQFRKPARRKRIDGL